MQKNVALSSRIFLMTLRTLYQYVRSLTRPVTILLKNCWQVKAVLVFYPPGSLPRSVTALHTPSAPLKGLAAVAIYGVQMLNAELELAARTG